MDLNKSSKNATEKKTTRRHSLKTKKTKSGAAKAEKVLTSSRVGSKALKQIKNQAKENTDNQGKDLTQKSTQSQSKKICADKTEIHGTAKTGIVATDKNRAIEAIPELEGESLSTIGKINKSRRILGERADQSKLASKRVKFSDDTKMLPSYDLDTKGEKTKKRSWNKHEDDKLIELVQIHGPSVWNSIAKQFTLRTGKQCRERWHNQLDPSLKRLSWSIAEEWILYILQRKSPNRWAEFVTFLFGRSDNAIKNYWNTALCYRRASFDAALENYFSELKQRSVEI